MNRDAEGCVAAIVVSVIVVGTAVMSYIHGYTAATREVRSEAYERGYGEYVADERGNTTWHWKGDDNED